MYKLTYSLTDTEHADHSGPITMPLIIRSLHSAMMVMFALCVPLSVTQSPDPLCTVQSINQSINLYRAIVQRHVLQWVRSRL